MFVQRRYLINAVAAISVLRPRKPPREGKEKSWHLEQILIEFRSSRDIKRRLRVAFHWKNSKCGHTTSTRLEKLTVLYRKVNIKTIITTVVFEGHIYGIAKQSEDL